MTHWFLFPNCWPLHHLHICAKWILALNCQNTFVTIRKQLYKVCHFAFLESMKNFLVAGRIVIKNMISIGNRFYLSFSFYCACPFFKEKCSDRWKKNHQLFCGLNWTCLQRLRWQLLHCCVAISDLIVAMC